MNSNKEIHLNYFYQVYVITWKILEAILKILTTSWKILLKSYKAVTLRKKYSYS